MTTITAQDTMFYVKDVDIENEQFTIELITGKPFCRDVVHLTDLPYKIRKAVMNGTVHFLMVDVHFVTPIGPELVLFKNWKLVSQLKPPRKSLVNFKPTSTETIGEQFASFADE